jgi:peptidoglycan/LPS O-acetylase OafA/YrhL
MNDKQFIPALTGVRAICLYLIFIAHVNIYPAGTYPDIDLLLKQFGPFITFFGVLSGFLIYYKYAEIGGLNKKKLYNYFINRLTRIYPVLFILVSLTFILGYAYGVYSLGKAVKLFILNITLLKGFSSEYYLSGIGPTWSLTVEECFYFLSPIIFLFIKSWLSLVKFIFLFFTMGLLLTYYFSHHPFHGLFSSYSFTFTNTFFGRVFEFACGIFLAMGVRGEINLAYLNKIKNTVLWFGILICLGAVPLLFFIAKSYNVPYATNTFPGFLVNNILIPIGIFLLFYSLIYQKSLLQKFLSSKIMTELGNSSYTFFLMHTTFVLSFIYKYISSNFLISLVLMIIISYIFYKTVEQPLSSKLRKKLSKKIAN